MPGLIVLDPAEVATARTQQDITPFVGPSVDWGDAAINAYMAEALRGQVPIDYRVPNRIIVMPLVIKAANGLTFEQARARVQAKAAMFQREGGWLKRTTSVGTMFADVVNATLHLGGQGYLEDHGTKSVDVDATLTLECIPEWYQAEVGNVSDDFSIDTIASGAWTFDTGSGTLAVSGGLLVPSSTAEKRLYFSAAPNLFSDCQVTYKITTGAAGAFNENVMVKRLAATSYLGVQVSQAALGSGSSAIGLHKFTGSSTDLGGVVTGTMPTLATATSYWLRARIEGNVLTGEFYTSAPTPNSSPVASKTVTIGGSDATTWGFGVQGRQGIRVLPGDTSFRYDDFAAEPFVYVERTNPELRAALTGIRGNYPCRARIVVNEVQGQNRGGLLGGIRSANYSAAATAALAYDVSTLTPLDAAAVGSLANASGGVQASGTCTTAGTTTLTLVSPTTGWANGMAITGTGIPGGTTISSGAGTATMVISNAATTSLAGTAIQGWGSNVIRHSTLTGNWTPVFSTTISAGALAMTHVGTYRVWVRAWTPSTAFGAPLVRLLWDVGDLILPVVNASVTLAAANNFYLLDLGEVRLDAPPLGTYRWQGMVQASGVSGNVSFDRLELVPVDDWYCKATTLTTSTNIPGLTSTSAQDGFDQTAGALTGKTLPIGGTWVGAGDTDDFSASGSSTATRVAVSDADVNTGRYVTASGPTLTGTSALLLMLSATAVVPTAWGVIVRYVDVNNWLMARVEQGTGTRIRVVKRVAGTVTTIADLGVAAISTPANLPAYVEILVDAAGNYTAWGTSLSGGGNVPSVTGQDAVLATGGALASGKVGFYDAQTVATASTRSYDQFISSPYGSDAAVYASQTAELRTEGMFREDVTGTAYGPISSVVGELPRLPPSGLEGRAAELFLKGSRGDLNSLPDVGVDDIAVQVLYRPCWLLIPE